MAAIFRGAENAPEPFDDSAVMVTILGQIEVVEHLRRASKADLAASLEHGESGHPDGNEAILPKRRTVPRIPDDLEREIAVASAMRELIRWGPSQGDTAQDKWASLVSEFLVRFLRSSRTRQMALSFLTLCFVRPSEGSFEWTEVKDTVWQEQKR